MKMSRQKLTLLSVNFWRDDKHLFQWSGQHTTPRRACLKGAYLCVSVPMCPGTYVSRVLLQQNQYTPLPFFRYILYADSFGEIRLYFSILSKVFKFKSAVKKTTETVFIVIVIKIL
jgi:hypothetical protein